MNFLAIILLFLFYFSRFDIVSLILGVTHGERLSRKGSIVDNGLEQIALIHCRKQECHTSRLAAQLDGDLVAVDVIDIDVLFLDVLIEAGGPYGVCV